MCFVYSGKALLALMLHYIDDKFKLREVLLFAKPFSSVAHTADGIEKTIKTGLASWGIGKYEPSATPPIDTVRPSRSLFCILIFALSFAKEFMHV